MDYQGFLMNKFSEIIDGQMDFVLSEEQQFVKDKDKRPDTLYIVYKELTGPTSYNVKSVNLQILILSEENSLEFAKYVAKKFADENNFAITKEGTEFVKHTYNQPAVLSNFNQIDVGARSIIYIPGSLQVMDGLQFISADGTSKYGIINIRKSDFIDEEHPNGDVEVKYLSFSSDYNMTPDTQQFPTGELAKTEKSTAGLSASLIIPLYDNKFVDYVIDIMNGNKPGNSEFTLYYFIKTKPIIKNMKIISAHWEDAPGEVPGLRIGFIL